MSTVTIRSATASDLPTVVALLADDALGATREEAGAGADPAYREAFAAIQHDPRNDLIVAEQDGEVIGVLQLTIIPSLQYEGGTRAQIEGVRVAKAHRNRGVGHTLVKEAIARARSMNCRLVQLTTNKQRRRALRFYESLGFNASHEGMKLFLR